MYLCVLFLSHCSKPGYPQQRILEARNLCTEGCSNCTNLCFSSGEVHPSDIFMLTEQTLYCKKNRREFMILTHFYRPYSTMAEFFISSVSSVFMACMLISLHSLNATFPLLRVSLKRGNEDTST